MQTIVNFSVLITMLCPGFSGIVLLQHVFAVLSIHGPMATARTMHLAASYWIFAAYYVSKGIGKISASKNSVQKKEGYNGRE